MSSDAAGYAQTMECPICMYVFDTSGRTPKVLSCGHSVCEHCIEGCIQRSKAKCPSCRHVSTVPAKGFPTNYVVTGFLPTAHLARRRCTSCQKETLYEELFVCTSCERAPGRASGICSLCALCGHKNHADAVLLLKDLAKPQAVQRACLDIEHSNEDIRVHIESGDDALKALHEDFEDANEIRERHYGEMLAALNTASYVTMETVQETIDDASELHEKLGSVLVDVCEKLKECQFTLRSAVRDYAVTRRVDQEDGGQEDDDEDEKEDDDDENEEEEEEKDAPSGSKKPRTE